MSDVNSGDDGEFAQVDPSNDPHACAQVAGSSLRAMTTMAEMLGVNTAGVIFSMFILLAGMFIKAKGADWVREQIATAETQLAKQTALADALKANGGIVGSA